MKIMKSVKASITASLLLTGSSHAASVLHNIDFIDDIFKAGGASAGSITEYSGHTANGFVQSQTFDVLDFSNGVSVANGVDGFDDIEIMVTTTGLGAAGGAYAGDTYTSELDTNATGLRSRLTNTGSNVPKTNPLVTSGTAGTAGAQFGGLNQLTQTIEIRFLNTLEVEVADVSRVGWSSSNTQSKETNAFEWSSVQALDTNFSPFSTLPGVIYEEDASATGYAGIGTKLGDGDTQRNVGTSNASTDALNSWKDDSLEVMSTGLLTSGLTSSTRIGGFRFSHNIIDTRGTADNGGFNYTATINDLDLKGIRVVSVPEPSRALLLGSTFLAMFLRRQRR